MSYIVVFLIVFVGGPLAFRALTNGGPSPKAFRRLTMFTAICAATGLALRYGFAELWGENLVVTGTGVTFIWGGWIGVLAYGAQAMRRMDGGLRMRRWTAVMGSVGTTVPWFGLASANLLAT
ncbi:hypothetical protein [Sulfitobacter donghicola]|uniref:Uncharacterized protein n=1 Tax=Sulfitobacter donghicola DSW-25 = KCTC 12864 = JCM 14565 TaxID=1300350 RepID=A0A073IZF6_9RHOB|nr:hypothetical protein [Sulfitobacter donghicola]KEJ90807.1 hypothetical protein DSW25_02595 [Sulfitobacter donghicola DSW-25 = KCTC 12864 = JCM 14565]KIN68081.1 hypothetical protein Z948_1808 [Sulfitobacter donghicola DSW-25 = KCTC 12864 = JCM 14565]